MCDSEELRPTPHCFCIVPSDWLGTCTSQAILCMCAGLLLCAFESDVLIANSFVSVHFAFACVCISPHPSHVASLASSRCDASLSPSFTIMHPKSQRLFKRMLRIQSRQLNHSVQQLQVMQVRHKMGIGHLLHYQISQIVLQGL